MAEGKTVHIPGIGKAPKGAVIAVVAVTGGILAYAWWKHSQASSTSSSTTPAGTGTGVQPRYRPYHPGAGHNFHPRHHHNQKPHPGDFADNAQWSQWAERWLVEHHQASEKHVAAALGLYVTGRPVDPAQQTIIDAAIAVAGRPPDAGPGGYPPAIRLKRPHTT